MVLEQKISERLENVQEGIAQAAARAGRSAGQVRLVVVSKAQPDDVVKAAIAVGVRRLGENYAEEALAKRPSVDPDRLVEWHMIGSVQSRKAILVAGNFDMLHSLDRVKLARRLQHSLSELDQRLPVLVQVNISAEATKSGFPAWDENRWSDVDSFIRELQAFDRLDIRGLMSIPPFSPNPEDARPYFQKTRRLRDRLSAAFPALDFSELSMGMSGDYETAVEEGATLVRIGTAILGQRKR
jgi:pyridoxal phosphate enzyme (YggS family)